MLETSISDSYLQSNRSTAAWSANSRGPRAARANTQHTVSVVMPVYNGEKYVEDALCSVLRQTISPTEIIVIDDGSTDRTLEILAAFEGLIRVIRQENKGHASARNAAAQIATGTWLAMIDADDLWEPTKLQKQLELVDRFRDGDVFYTATANFEDSARVDDVTFGDRECPAGCVFEDLLLENFITHSSILMRRSDLLCVGGYDENLKTTCDWDLWLRMAASGCRFHGIKETLTRYRWRATSNSKNHQRTGTDRLMVLTKALETAFAENISPRLRKIAIANVWKTSAWFAAEKNDSMALEWYLKSAKNNPYNVQCWKEVVRCCAHLCGISRSKVKLFGRKVFANADQV